jgi:hypothetical protein
MKRKDGLTCGHRGAVTKLTWEYLRTDKEGDHYTFERLFPFEEPTQSSEVKEVTYQGQELVVFEDDVHRIVIRPAPSE